MQPIKASLIGLATFFIFYLSMLSIQLPWMLAAGIIGLLTNTFLSGFSALYHLRDGMLTALAYSAPMAVFSALTVGYTAKADLSFSGVQPHSLPSAQVFWALLPFICFVWPALETNNSMVDIPIPAMTSGLHFHVPPEKMR